MKRGEMAPWKLRFEWENGARGTIAFTSKDAAETRARSMLAHAELRDMILVIKIEEKAVR